MDRKRDERFGELLRRYRLSAGLTQEALAERAGLSVRGLSDLERGIIAAPRPDTVRLLSDALGLDEEVRPRFLEAARPHAPAPQPLTAPLPVPLTPLLGRGEEMAAAMALLRQPQVRLVTFTGAGGTGKTRLALEVVSELGPAFTDGAAFVPLAAVRDPDLLPSTLVQALGMTVGGATPEESILAALRGRRLLLCLDNFEQILAAAPFVVMLLEACPRVTALVTSRAPLRVQGEHEFPVPPLPVPDPSVSGPTAELRDYPSIALFVERARAVAPWFSLTAENSADVAAVCTRLDGLPLAIELAAPRVKILPPASLRRELERGLLSVRGGRDRPQRQQTLRATLQWSYDLLDPALQRFFRELSVFVGGWTFASAARVCTAGEDLVEGSLALADWSLIRPAESGGDEQRFSMLETLREFGLGLLGELGEEEVVRRRHAGHFLALAERAEMDHLSRSPIWTERIGAEMGNLREALGWAVGRRDAAVALRLSAALEWYWRDAWQAAEGIRRLEEALALPAGGPAERARALATLGDLQWMRGRLVAARRTLESAVETARPLDDRYPLVRSLLALAHVLFEFGEHRQAQVLAQEMLRESRALHMDRLLAYGLLIAGEIELRLGDDGAAAELVEEALDIFRTTGTDVDVILALVHRGELALRRGDGETAAAAHEDAVALAYGLTEPRQRARAMMALGWLLKRLGYLDRTHGLFEEILRSMRASSLTDRSMLAWSINHFADMQRLQGRLDEASALYKESLGIFRDEAEGQGIAAVLHNLGHVAMSRGDFAASRRFFRESLDMFVSLGYMWSVADALAGIACLVAQEGHAEVAAQLFGGADALHDAIDPSGSSGEPANLAAWEEGMSGARRALGEEAWTRLHEAGAKLSLDEAIALARQGTM